MTDLIINQKTKQNINDFLYNPAHAILFCGQNGLGVDSIAHDTAKKLAGNQIFLITPDEKKKTILVDVIRNNVIKIVSNHQNKPFAVVINDAETMTISAQNSLLKVLEEPVTNVYFILSTHSPEKLLPTILSRIQTIEVLPVSLSETEKILDKFKITVDKKQKITFLSAKKPAEMTKLLNDEMYYRDKASLVETAKNFISGNTYERLKIISNIKHRSDAIDFVKILADLILFLVKNKEVPNLSEKLAIISDVSDNLRQNGNVKAQLTYLAVNYE